MYKIRPTYLLVFVLTFGAFYLILYATSLYGIGTSPDSIGYISVANNISDGEGFVTYTEAEFVVQPPLYPVILAAAKWGLGIEPLKTARYLNALVMGIIVATSIWITSNLVRSSFILPLFAAIWALFAIPLFAVSVMAWTEPLFILFTICFLISMQRYLAGEETRWLAISAFFASLATLTRYIGVTLIASGALLILFTNTSPLTARIKRLVFWGIASISPLCTWLLRNWTITDTFMGERAPSSRSFVENIAYTLLTIVEWFFPERLLNKEFVIFAVVVSGLFGIYLLATHAGRKIRRKMERSATKTLLTFITIYTAFLIVSSTTTAFDRINHRLLSPIYIPLVIFALLILDSAMIQVPQKYQKGVNTAVIFLIGCWTLYPIVDTLRQAQVKAENGAGGYSSKVWAESDTIEYLQQNRARFENHDFYSNRPDVLYRFLQINSKKTPAKFYYASTKRANDLTTLSTTWLETNPSYLVWFESGRSYLYSIEELSTIIDVSTVVERDDGTIYKIARKN